jgi:antitoxin YefM
MEELMNAVTLADAKENLEQLVEQVLADAEPAILCTEKGEKVVLVSLDEFNSWKETIYLLGNPANAAHLRESIAEARAGKLAEKSLVDA